MNKVKRNMVCARCYSLKFNSDLRITCGREAGAMLKLMAKNESGKDTAGRKKFK